MLINNSANDALCSFFQKVQLKPPVKVVRSLYEMMSGWLLKNTSVDFVGVAPPGKS